MVITNFIKFVIMATMSANSENKNKPNKISPILLKFYFLFGCGDLELNPTITAR